MRLNKHQFAAFALRLPGGHRELLNPPTAIFGDIDVVFGIHGDAVGLVEIAGEVPDAPTET